MLDRREPSRERDDPAAVDRDERDRQRRIRCRRCGWPPSRDDRWSCDCAHVWNTFDTRSVCPACEQRWTETQCLACGEWSRHDDWYA